MTKVEPIDPNRTGLGATFIDTENEDRYGRLVKWMNDNEGLILWNDTDVFRTDRLKNLYAVSLECCRIVR